MNFDRLEWLRNLNKETRVWMNHYQSIWHQIISCPVGIYW